jgi:segregation and condensation protein B
VSVEPDRLAVLEALLFVAEEPLPLSKLCEVLGDAGPGEVETWLRDLALRLETEGRGLMVQEVAGGFRLATRPEVHPWIQRLQQVRPARLSRAALETLAIVAYRQPITRAEIEAIRGVAVDGVLRTLLERELIRMMGRKAEAGRPMLYGTSQQFLEHFGLRELGDLPTLRELNELIGSTETGPADPPPTGRPRPGAETGDMAVDPRSDADRPGAADGTPERPSSRESSAEDGQPTAASLDTDGPAARGTATDPSPEGRPVQTA